MYIRYFGREITKFNVIYGVYVRFWPILVISNTGCGVAIAQGINKIVQFRILPTRVR